MTKQQKHIRAIISGGGTGGHIFPALSIANEIKRRFPNAEILFVGAKYRMEMEKVPANGYPIEGLWISGINRKKMLKNLAFPFKLLSSFWKALRIINRFKPEVVIGTGGFASGPILFVAQQKGIPTFIQEQNSYPGITNKLLSKKVRKIYTAHDNLERFFDAKKIMKTGNPVRKEFASLNIDKSEAVKKFDLLPGKKTILSIGGSLGAHPLNEGISNILDKVKEKDYQIIWQTGKNDFENYKQLNNKNIKVVPFITNMPYAYAAADLIISRAGAGTISELTLIGKPVILVPSPYVAEDHQTKNAKALAENNAAVLLPEMNLKQDLWQVVSEIFENDEKAEKLSQNIKELAMPDATEQIVNDIINELKLENDIAHEI